MAAWALRLAVRNRLRSAMALDDLECDVTGPSGRPHPAAGQRFVAVHAGPWSNDANESLDERFGVEVTVTVRTPFAPADRVGTAAQDDPPASEEDTTGLEALAESVRAELANGRYAVMDAANALLLASREDGGAGENVWAFVEPLRFRDGGPPVERGGEWFAADPGGMPEGLAGLSMTLSFRDARRVQKLGEVI